MDRSTTATIEPPAGTWLITGARGFIGAHLIQRLTAAGLPVVAVDLQRPAGLPPGTEFVYCDITRPEHVDKTLRGRQVDYAVHLAAKVGDWGPREQYERVNVDGTRRVLRALLDAGCGRLLHVSSIAAMGYTPGSMASETVAPITDTDPYSATKARGELVARRMQQDGAPIVIIRPGDVFGPGSVPWVVRPIEMLKKRQMIYVDGGRGHFAHVWIDNLLDGMLLAAESDDALGQTYILTDEEQDTTFAHYFGALADIAGTPRPSLSLPRSAAMTLATLLELAGHALSWAPPITTTAVKFVTRKCSFDISKAKRELGYRPTVGLDEGLRLLSAALAPPKSE